MYATFLNGRVEVFMWEDLLEGEDWRGVVEATPIHAKGHRGHECRKKILKDEEGIYFMWDGQKVYLDQYDHLSPKDLVSMLEQAIAKGERGGCQDKILAAMMKAPDRFRVYARLPVYDMIVPELGFGVCSDKEELVPCVPTERHYKMTNWGYKFTLEAEDPSKRAMVASRDFYFSDFVSMLMTGHMKLEAKEAATT